MVHVIFVVACDTLGPNRRGCHKSKLYGAEKFGGGGEVVQLDDCTPFMSEEVRTIHQPYKSQVRLGDLEGRWIKKPIRPRAFFAKFNHVWLFIRLYG